MRPMRRAIGKREIRDRGNREGAAYDAAGEIDSAITTGSVGKIDLGVEATARVQAATSFRRTARKFAEAMSPFCS